MSVCVFSWDLPDGMPEVTDYFTEENSATTLDSGIWSNVYVGLIDCGISDQIFDCLNITRTLYLHLTWTDKMVLHKVRGLFRGFREKPYESVREAIFSALYYLLYRSKQDPRLIRIVRDCVDYDHGYYGETDFDVFYNMIQDEDERGEKFDNIVVATPDWEDYAATKEGQEAIGEVFEGDMADDDWLFPDFIEPTEEELIAMNIQAMEELDAREAMLKVEAEEGEALQKLMKIKKKDIEQRIKDDWSLAPSDYWSTYLTDKASAEDMNTLKALCSSEEASASSILAHLAEMIRNGKMKKICDSKKKVIEELNKFGFAKSYKSERCAYESFRVAAKGNLGDKVFATKA